MHMFHRLETQDLERKRLKCSREHSMSVTESTRIHGSSFPGQYYNLASDFQILNLSLFFLSSPFLPSSFFSFLFFPSSNRILCLKKIHSYGCGKQTKMSVINAFSVFYNFSVIGFIVFVTKNDEYYFDGHRN